MKIDVFTLKILLGRPLWGSPNASALLPLLLPDKLPGHVPALLPGLVPALLTGLVLALLFGEIPANVALNMVRGT